MYQLVPPCPWLPGDYRLLHSLPWVLFNTHLIQLIQVTLASNCRSSFGGGRGVHCTSPYLFSPPSRVNPSKAGQHMGLLDRMHFRQGGQNRIIRNMRGGGSASRGKLPKHILQCKRTTPEVSKMQTKKKKQVQEEDKKLPNELLQTHFFPLRNEFQRYDSGCCPLESNY